MADILPELIARVERLEALAGIDNETQPALGPDALAILPEDHAAHQYQARTLKEAKSGPAYEYEANSNVKAERENANV